MKMILANYNRDCFTNLMSLIIIFNFTFFLIPGCTGNSITRQITTPPNFLVLIADDAGWRDFGCYGNPYIHTPNIDALASKGFKANNAFLTIPQCSPSRISILTGKYPHATGAEDLHMPLPESEKILPTYLKQKGYYTGVLKKAHLGPYGEKQFDWYSKDLEDFEAFLDSAGTSPFFMWIGFTDPHRPYKKGIIENPQKPENVIVPPTLIDNKETREDLADYYNEIRRMDWRIGTYVKSLEKRNKIENTCIIFFSDNGAPFPRAKGSLYDTGVKTPLIFSWPGTLNAGIEYDDLMSVIDLAPTILEIADIPIPGQMQGKSIFDVLKNPQLPGRRYVYGERNWHNCDEHMRSIRSSRFKLITNAYTDLPHGSPSDITKSPSWQSLYNLKSENRLNKAQSLIFTVPRPEEELYDILKDPDELNNIINDPDYQDVLKELRHELTVWKENTGDFPPEQRRRKDNTDRFTGNKFDQTRLPETK